MTPKEGQTEEQARDEVLRRFERIGLQIMSRSGGGPFDPDPISSVLSDPSKRTVAAQILGQAYVTAHNVTKTNRAGIDRIADALEARLEIMGDELIELLDTSGLTIPEFDLADEASWPPAEFSAAVGRGGQRASRPSGDRGEDVSDATVPNETAARVHRRRAGAAGRAEQRLEQRPDEDATASRSDKARRSAYHSRFVGVYIALALVAGLGVGALVASIMRDDTSRPKAAAPAQFTPSKAGELGAIELARSVEQKYRLADGQELTGVIASRNTLQDGQGGSFRVRFQLVEPFDATGNPDNKIDHAGKRDPVHPLRRECAVRDSGHRLAPPGSGCSSDRGSSSPCVRSRTTAASTTSPSSSARCHRPTRTGWATR